MTRLMAVALAVVVAAVMGFGAGWHAKGVSVTAGQVKESQQAMREITRSVAEQSEKQQADMREEQTKSVALAAELAMVRAAGADIRLEIDHAAFRPTPLVAGA